MNTKQIQSAQQNLNLSIQSNRRRCGPPSIETMADIGAVLSAGLSCFSADPFLKVLAAAVLFMQFLVKALKRQNDSIRQLQHQAQLDRIEQLVSRMVAEGNDMSGETSE